MQLVLSPIADLGRRVSRAGRLNSVVDGYLCAWQNGGVSLLQPEMHNGGVVALAQVELAPTAPLCLTPDLATAYVPCDNSLEVYSTQGGLRHIRSIGGKYSCAATADSLYLFDVLRGEVLSARHSDPKDTRCLLSVSTAFDEVELDGVVAEWLCWGNLALLSLSSPHLTAVIELRPGEDARVSRDMFAVAAFGDRLILSRGDGAYCVRTTAGAIADLPCLVGEAAVEAADDYPHFLNEGCVVHLRSGRVGSILCGESQWRDCELLWLGGAPDLISTNWIDRTRMYTNMMEGAKIWEVSLTCL